LRPIFDKEILDRTGKICFLKAIEKIKRGHEVPYFIRSTKMIENAHIFDLANDGLKDTDKFPVEVLVKGSNIITVLIDGDTPVTIDDCIKLSKHIESNLDRDAEDFELRVSSFGADKPLIMKRQYKKNIGRELNIVLNDETIVCGKLENADDQHLTISAKNEKKKNGKPEVVKIDFNNIKEAVVVLSFK
jgi:ribosome maturation factor RimP